MTRKWRERRRASAVAEIKDVARELLVSGGPPAMSLRAISREMGMTASGLYRYFPSLDALVASLRADFFEELRQAMVAARGEVQEDDPVLRLQATARGFRGWALEHREEFGLTLGPPVPGAHAEPVPAPEEGREVREVREGRGDQEDRADGEKESPQAAQDPATDCFAHVFISEFTELQRRGRLRTPAIGRDTLASQLSTLPLWDAVDLPVLFAFLTTWARLYGVISMEVYGHMPWAASDGEALFEAELANFAQQLALPEPVSGEAAQGSLAD